MSRRAITLTAAAALAALAFLVWRVLTLVPACGDGSCAVGSGLKGTAATVVVVAFVGAVVAVVWWPRRVAVGVATGVVALVAAAPVDAGWDDGCNDHGAASALGVALVHAATTPEDARGVFWDVQTLKACMDGPPRFQR